MWLLTLNLGTAPMWSVLSTQPLGGALEPEHRQNRFTGQGIGESVGGTCVVQEPQAGLESHCMYWSPCLSLRAWAELGTTYPHRKQPESKSGQGHRVSGTKLLSCWEGTSSRGPHFLESATGCLVTGKSQARWEWLFAPKKTAGWINMRPPCHLHLSRSLSVSFSQCEDSVCHAGHTQDSIPSLPDTYLPSEDTQRPCVPTLLETLSIMNSWRF